MSSKHPFLTQDTDNTNSVLITQLDSLQSREVSSIRKRSPRLTYLFGINDVSVLGAVNILFLDIQIPRGLFPAYIRTNSQQAAQRFKRQSTNRLERQSS